MLDAKKRTVWKTQKRERKDSLGYGESNANKIFIKTLIANTDMVPYYKIKKKWFH